MQVNKIQPTNNDLKKQNTPNFKGLYFRTPEVKEVVSRMPKFVEFLKKDEVKELAKKFNIVITDYVSNDIVEYVYVFTKLTPVVKSLKTRILEGLGLKEKTPNYKTTTIEKTYSEPVNNDVVRELSNGFYVRSCARECNVNDQIFTANTLNALGLYDNTLYKELNDYPKPVEKVVGRKPLNDFYFRACTSVDNDNDEILPKGLYTKLIQASATDTRLGHSLDADLHLLKMNEQFEKLKFSNQEEKEKFLNKEKAYELLDNYNIQKLLADGKKIIITDGERGSFCIANAIEEDKDGTIKPYGFRTRKYHNIQDFDRNFHFTIFDSEDGFNRMFFASDEVKEKFLDSMFSTHLLLSSDFIKATNKYNLFVTEADDFYYTYCLSTDLAIDGDNVIPAGLVTPSFNVKDGSSRLADLFEHLEFIMDVNGLAANSDMEEKLDV